MKSKESDFIKWEDFLPNEYGIFALFLYLGTLVIALMILIRTKDNFCKKQAIIVIVMIVGSLFFSMEHWTSTSFLIYTSIGIMMGKFTVARKQKQLDV